MPSTGFPIVNMAGSNQGASSAYTEAGPPEMMTALKSVRATEKKTIKTNFIIQHEFKMKTIRKFKGIKNLICSPVSLFSNSKGWGL